MILQACLKLHVWDAVFKLFVWVLKWCWDAGLRALRLNIGGMLRCRLQALRLALQWCWDAGFEPCVLALHEWLQLASHLKHGPCYLMTCLQWFLDNLHNSLQSFQNTAVDWNGFRNTLDLSVGSKLSRLDWPSSEISRARSCLDFGLLECTVKLFEATRDDCREYPET